MPGPRPIPAVGGTTPMQEARPVSWTATPADSAASLKALLELAAPAAASRLPWREGQQLTARILASTAHEATLQLGQTVLTARTGLALPAGAQAELVVRRVHGERVELQLTRLETDQTGPATRAGQQASGLAALPADAWQAVFVLPGDQGHVSVTGLPAPDRDGKGRAEANTGERLVIRWESLYLGAVEIELDVGSAAAGGPAADRAGDPVPLRLAARAAAKDAAAALRTGLAGLSDRLQALGFAVRSRTVGPLRRKATPARSGLRLDTRL